LSAETKNRTFGKKQNQGKTVFFAKPLTLFFMIDNAALIPRAVVVVAVPRN
jgi:hypothetical protein